VHRRHTLSVTGTVSGDVVRRSVVDPVKCGACHEWFEGHGGNRNIGLGSASAPIAGKDNGIVVCALCHVPNLSSSGRGADPATVLSRMTTSDQQKMTAAGFNPANPSTYPEESMNFKDLIHATHASAFRVEPFRFVRDRGTSGVFYYDMSEVTFPGRLGDCEICHYSGTVKPYDLPATAGLLSSTNETTDGNTATSVTTDRSTVPNASDIVTPPFSAACITCHDQNLPVTHIEAQGGSSKVKRSDAVR
jgi:OmcA/MtrC family decaheme c-type cytochrome